MRAPEGRVGEMVGGSIDEAAVAAYMAGLATPTPCDTTRDARALATIVRDPWRVPTLPLSRATFAEALRRMRLRLIEEAWAGRRRRRKGRQPNPWTSTPS